MDRINGNFFKLLQDCAALVDGRIEREGTSLAASEYENALLHLLHLLHLERPLPLLLSQRGTGGRGRGWQVDVGRAIGQGTAAAGQTNKG